MGVHDHPRGLHPVLPAVQLQAGRPHTAGADYQRLGVLDRRYTARFDLWPWQLARHDVCWRVSVDAILHSIIIYLDIAFFSNVYQLYKVSMTHNSNLKLINVVLLGHQFCLQTLIIS